MQKYLDNRKAIPVATTITIQERTFGKWLLPGILQLRTFTGAGGVITAGRGLPTGSIVYNSPVFKITGIVGKQKKLAVLFYFYGN